MIMRTVSVGVWVVIVRWIFLLVLFLLFNVAEAMLTLIVILFRWTFTERQWFLIDAATCNNEMVRLFIRLLIWSCLHFYLHLDFFLPMFSLSTVFSFHDTFFSADVRRRFNRNTGASCNWIMNKIDLFLAHKQFFFFSIIWLDWNDVKIFSRKLRNPKINLKITLLIIWH